MLQSTIKFFDTASHLLQYTQKLFDTAPVLLQNQIQKLYSVLNLFQSTVKFFDSILNLLQNGNQTFHSGSEPTSEYEGNAQNALLHNFAAPAKRIIEKWSYRFIRLSFRSDALLFEVKRRSRLIGGEDPDLSGTLFSFKKSPYLCNRSYSIEIDYDYIFHDGAFLASPTRLALFCLNTVQSPFRHCSNATQTLYKQYNTPI